MSVPLRNTLARPALDLRLAHGLQRRCSVAISPWPSCAHAHAIEVLSLPADVGDSTDKCIRATPLARPQLLRGQKRAAFSLVPLRCGERSKWVETRATCSQLQGICRAPKRKCW